MKTKTWLIASALSLTGMINAQVTIGSDVKANAGALLDLKENNNVGANSSSGLGTPRMNLTSLTITNASNGVASTIEGTEASDNWNKDQHIGLTIYNLTDNGYDICPGIHVWDGDKWQRLGKGCTIPRAVLNLSTSGPLYFPSGQDLRTITAQTVDVEWKPATATVAWTPSANNAAYDQIVFNATTGITPAWPWALPTQTVSLLPDAMTAAEVSANPFLTKETKLTFTATNDGATASKDVAINQTNKALTLATPSYTPTTALSGDYTNTLKSNAKWKLVSIEPSNATRTISNLKLNGTELTLGTEFDWEQYNNQGQGATSNLTYTLTVGGSKVRKTVLTFVDASDTKRFNDVTLTIDQCSNVGVAPKLSEWALLAGFEGVADTKISDADDAAKKINIPNSTTGIAWHRDQDGNIFLSASYAAGDITGDTERWMLTNLAAKTFDVTRTDDFPLRDANLTQKSYSDLISDISPLWLYPKPDNSSFVAPEAAPDGFVANPTLGLLYNYPAVSNSRPADGATETENMNITRPKIQGICPAGWHLPNDVEWTTLEQEFNTNTQTYSSATANANSTIVLGGNGFRGTPLNNPNGHGNAMKNECNTSAYPNLGTSNAISTTKRPGFNALLPGCYLKTNSTAAPNYYGYNKISYFYSASTSGASHVVVRVASSASSGIGRTIMYRYNLFSVRCKKDI